MKDVVAKIKAALSRQGAVVPHLAYYLVKDRYIHASDGRMTAAAPFPSDMWGEFLVPGEEFELLLERLPGEPEIIVEPSRIKMRSGRMRGTIETLPVAEAHYAGPELEWANPPEGLLQAFRRIRPFISDNAVHYWALCAALGDGVMLATNNVSLVEVSCPGLKGRDSLLPLWAVDYVLARTEPLTGWQIADSYAAFRWEDGSWMRTQLVSATFPEEANALLARMAPPTWEVPDEWREAYFAVAGALEEIIEIDATAMRGKKGKAAIEHEVASPCVRSRWNPKFLDAVVRCAARFQLDAYPAAASFEGNGIRGLIVGRS